MDPYLIGLLGLGTVLFFVFLGVPMAFALTLIGFAGNLMFFTFNQTSVRFFEAVIDSTSNFVLVAVPLFIFMGQLVKHGNIGRDLYDCVYKWFGRFPGGLAITAVISSAGFGAVTGISAASVATMGSITLPEMKRYGYDMRMGAGAIAIASSLSILVPPSVLMIIYGLWTETSIGHLFIAGIVPAAILASLFCFFIFARCLINPKLGPLGEEFALSDKFRSLLNLLPIIFLFSVIISGIYGGVFTVSEASGIGAAATLVILLFMRRLSVRTFTAAAVETGRLTVMVLTIFIAATFFAKFLVVTDLAYELIDLIEGTDVGRYYVFTLVALLFLGLGMILDAIGMLLLALPLVFPIVIGLGFDPVWFGIIVTILTEIALVTPPVGVNCFIIRQISPDIGLADVFMGAAPFVALALFTIVILTIFPSLVLWLPATTF